MTMDAAAPHGSSQMRAPRGAGRRRRVVLSAGVSLATVLSVLSVGASVSTDAAIVGPGSVALAPPAVPASSTGIAVQLRYTAPKGGLSGGIVKVTVPRGWSAPQKRSPWRKGYVTASAGVLRVNHRSIKVSSLKLCGGCALVIGYSGAKAPARSRMSRFLTTSAPSSAANLAPVAVQPTVAVIGSGGSTSAAQVPIGDYAGAGNPAGVAWFGRATGTHPTLASDYLVGTGGWGAMDSARGVGAWRGSGYQLVLGVPILPGGTGATLAAGASGAYNGYFVTLAQNLISQGEAGAYLRLGWEFNATWYNWSVQNAGDAANFAAYFRNIVDAMRSVPGERFRFVWNPNGDGPTNYTPDQAYPGSRYVDFVGSDVYGNCWCSPFTPQSGWASQLSHPWGLDWLASFAAQVGRPIVFPEWSVDYRPDGHGLGDDAYFIHQFAAWIGQNGVAWTNIFSYNAPDQENNILDGHFPSALAAFRADFG